MDLKCRTCLELTTIRDIDLKNETKLIAEIELLIGIKIAIHEKYPSSICSVCVEKVNEFINFRHLVIETDSRIQEYVFNDSNLGDVKIESDIMLPEELSSNSNFGEKPSDEVYENNIGNMIKSEELELYEPKFESVDVGKVSDISLQKDIPKINIQQISDSEQSVEVTFQGKYKCIHCNKVFSQQRECINHRKKVHLRRICNVCGTSMRSDHIWKHMQKHRKESNASRIHKKIDLQSEQMKSYGPILDDSIETEMGKLKENKTNINAKFDTFLREISLGHPDDKVDGEGQMSEILYSRNIPENKNKKKAKQSVQANCERKYCEPCDIVFVQPKDYYNHRKKVHLRQNCSVCDISIRSDCMRKHLQKHQKESIADKVCKKVNVQGEQVKSLGQRHKGNNIRKDIGKSNKNNMEAKDESFLEQVGPGEPEFKIDMNMSEENHLKDIVENQKDLKDINKNFEEILERKYKCKYCDKIFSQQIEYYKHKRSVHLRKECPICGTTVRTDHMSKHMQLHYGKPVESKIRKCQDCDEIFSQHKDYISHRRSVHLRKICTVCGISVRPDYMATHMLKHQEDPVTCKICNKVLKHKLTLQIHMRRHRGVKYECELCGRVCKARSDFRRHLNEHKDPNIYKTSCKVCGKRVFDVKKHMQTHTGERPHICKFCEKGFTSPYALKVHVRQHTNEKPYVCQYCSMGFHQKVSLVTHLRSKHRKQD